MDDIRVSDRRYSWYTVGGHGYLVRALLTLIHNVLLTLIAYPYLTMEDQNDIIAQCHFYIPGIHPRHRSISVIAKQTFY